MKAFAMAAIIQSRNWQEDIVARQAFRFADAMIAEKAQLAAINERKNQ